MDIIFEVTDKSNRKIRLTKRQWKHIHSVKYLNGNGFIITSFYTNRITGSKWRI